MHHALKSLDGTVDSLSVFRPESGDDVARTVIDVSYSVDCSNSTDFHKTVSAGECAEARLHCSVMTHVFAYCRSCSCAVVSVTEQALKSVLSSYHSHVYIRKCCRIADGKVIERCSTDDRYHYTGTNVESDASAGQLSHDT